MHRWAGLNKSHPTQEAMSWPSYPGCLDSLRSASGPSRVPPPFPAKECGLQDSSKGLICSRALARRSGKGKTGYLFSWLTDCLSWAGWLIPFAQSSRQLPPDSLPHTFILLRLLAPSGLMPGRAECSLSGSSTRAVLLLSCPPRTVGKSTGYHVYHISSSILEALFQISFVFYKVASFGTTWLWHWL